MEKLLEAKRDPRVTKLHNEYAEKIASAEQLYDYTKCGNDAVGAYKEYERQIHAAEDFLDNGKRELYSDFSLTNEKYYKNIPTSEVAHKILKVLDEHEPEGLSMEEANILVKPDTIAKGKGCMFGDFWIMLLYKYNWIKTKRVPVSNNVPYREVRYIVTDEGKKALDAFERFRHVPDVDYDNYMKSSSLLDSDFEEIYNKAH